MPSLKRILGPLLGLALGLTIVLLVREHRTAPPASWPTIESCALDLDLREPGRFSAVARLELADVADSEVAFLLNRDLEVERARVDGLDVAVEHAGRLPGRYHAEGRLVRVRLDAPPADGRASLELAYSGPAARGTKGSDWRGILFVDAHEARMSEQTVFYPQVSVDLASPSIARTRFELAVRAPEDWSVFAPLPEVPAASADVREFRGARPQVLSLLAGVRARREVRAGDAVVTTLLRAEHAHLAEDFATAADETLAEFSRRFGAIDAGALCVFEMTCRSDSSYNWTSDGVLAFDRHALGAEIPLKTFAHEVAHLWWGQTVRATGPGERFLTEGGAEFAALTFLEDSGRAEQAEAALRTVRERVAALVVRGESDGLRDVGFDHEHYRTLAYAKGALVLRTLRGQLPPGALDAALARLVQRARGPADAASGAGAAASASDAGGAGGVTSRNESGGADAASSARGSVGAADGAGERTVDLDDLLAELRAAVGPALRVPWLDAGGDLDLALTGLELVGADRVAVTIEAKPATARCRVDPRGAPVALLLGGPGWRTRHTLLLEGPRTRVELDTQGRTPSFARLDPDDAWTRHVRRGTFVLDGAAALVSDPAPGAVVPFGGRRVVLEFDRALAPPNLAALRAGQSHHDGAAGLVVREVALSEDGTRLEITTIPWEPATRYVLRLERLRDAEGLPLASSALEFTTGSSKDRTRPRIVASVPAAGAVVPSNTRTLSVTFDEPMLRGRGFGNSDVRAFDRRGIRFPKFDDSGTWDTEFRTLTYAISDLEPGATYGLPFTGGHFRDLSGNRNEDFELVFRVEDVPR